jgi:hypothetical protein
MILSIFRSCLKPVCLVVLLPSCRENQKNTSAQTVWDTALNTQPKQITVSKQPHVAGDTTITYSIEGLSAEGSELEAHYIRDTIKEVTWKLYGETGQSVIKYIFLNKVVMAEEKNYVYEKSITEVNNEGDIRLKSQLNYVLDTSGN